MEDFILPRCINVIQIGCGGTGSYFMPPMVKFLSSIHGNSEIEIKYYLIDNDIVESKNVARQNFTINDIDKYKCSVLKNRYDNNNLCIDLDLKIDDSTSEVILNYMHPIDDTLTIIVGCVDNIETRLCIARMLMKFFNKFSQTKHAFSNQVWYVDSGNFIDSGQSLVFKYNDYYETAKVNEDKIKQIFSTKEAKLMDTMPSCANNGDQSIFANFRAADILFSIVSEILFRGDTTVKRVSFLRYSLDTEMDMIEQLKHGMA